MRTFVQKPKTAQQTMFAKSTIPSRANFEQSREVNQILHFQRTIGNQAVQRLLQPNAEELQATATTASTRIGHDSSRIPIFSLTPVQVQPRLTTSTPGDTHEQKANHPPTSDGKAEGPRIVNKVLRSPGQPLDSTTKAFFEPRFGRDFSNVRVHHDAPATESARALNARAYTIGGHIVFDKGQYKPNTVPGRGLLAHELAHVVQQRGESSGVIQRWEYGKGTHTTGGGNTLDELTEDEREGPNGMDKAMTIVDRLVTGTDWRAKHCQKWYDDNCTVARTLPDIHDRAVIWAWRSGDGASGWGLTDGSDGAQHAVTDDSLAKKSYWFLASVIIHEYWHDCDTAGDPDIGNEAEQACGLPGYEY